jgi:hypothetical protein
VTADVSGRTSASDVRRPAALSEKHWRELTEASAIPPELILEEGITTFTTRAEPARCGYTEDWQQAICSRGLAFPVHAPDGSNTLAVVKPDQPRPRRERPDKWVKYEWPVGHPHRLDVPVQCLPWLSDRSVPVFVVEGKKKALAILAYYLARGERVVVICLWGVWAWCRKQEDYGDARPELLDDWNLIPVDGRQVLIPFDSDRDEKQNVDHAARTLANRLDERGAEVYHIWLPTEPDGSKNGADDLIARHGPEAFQACVEAALDRGAHGTEALRGAWRRQRALIRELQAERSALVRALHNPAIQNGSARILGVSILARAKQQREKGKTGPLRFPIDATNSTTGERFGLATDTGLGRNTIGRAIKTLAEPLGKALRFTPGDEHPHIELDLPDDFNLAAELDRLATFHPEPESTKKRHGGKRDKMVRCDHCPKGTPLKTVCTRCGAVLDEQPNPPRDGVHQDGAPVAAEPVHHHGAPVQERVMHQDGASVSPDLGAQAARETDPRSTERPRTADGVHQHGAHEAPSTGAPTPTPLSVLRVHTIDPPGCPGPNCGAPLAPGEPYCLACFEMVNLIRVEDVRPPPSDVERPSELKRTDDIWDEIMREMALERQSA